MNKKRAKDSKNPDFIGIDGKKAFEIYNTNQEDDKHFVSAL